jgi:pimeloyl-ACP methyl ester carboxylesterase
MAEGIGTQREFVKALKSLRTPTLIIWGSEDRMMPVGNATGWLEQLSGATLTVIDRAGHLLLDESKSARNEVARFLSALGTLPEA